MCRYEEGHNIDWVMAELCVAFAEDQPDCKAQLLQAIKECFRQILKVSAFALTLMGLGQTQLVWLGTRYVDNIGFKFGQMSFTLEHPKLMFVHLLKPSD